ncbi:DUF6745 domain-containing protein [Actinomadura sp. HBU206391]|uniref:DUF6745 domain-containing protein n=1 Tax=Actinomadura sp. HBU206391 TaxID=2731692 RepID=UPI00164F9ED7|nr:hypothetical protein [Actinomadura sp. HBU206391]MBC6459043.1 hypothetical protein [Actinomadura sp. HBU206391]
MSTLVAQDWHAVAFATGPADRAGAEAGIRSAYEAAGLTGPEWFVWVPSPAHGAVTAALLTDRQRTLATLRPAELACSAASAEPVRDQIDPGPSVRDAVRTLPWEAARTAAFRELGPREWGRMWARTGGGLWDQVNVLVNRIRQGIGELRIGDLAGDDGRGVRRGIEVPAGDGSATALLRAVTLDAVLGQHDAPWLAAFDAVDGLGRLAGVAGAARSAGWWWPYQRVAIVSERPVELHRDEPGRLHRGDGPALCYPGGFALHAWRGMPMPADFTATLSGLTSERIAAETNAEMRRVMLEHYGYDRYLAETGAKPVHRDEAGVLWRIDLPGDEPVAMVEVVNSTPEPDGTSRTYYLRVPPRMRTAHEGVAWTFGLSADDYRPEKQT